MRTVPYPFPRPGDTLRTPGNPRPPAEASGTMSSRSRRRAPQCRTRDRHRSAPPATRGRCRGHTRGFKPTTPHLCGAAPHRCSLQRWSHDPSGLAASGADLTGAQRRCGSGTLGKGAGARPCMPNGKRTDRPGDDDWRTECGWPAGSRAAARAQPRAVLPAATARSPRAISRGSCTNRQHGNRPPAVRPPAAE